MVLRDCRQYGWFFAEIDGLRAKPPHGVDQVQVRAHARERLLDPFERPDGHPELSTCRRVGADAAHGRFREADVGRRQRDRAPGREALHQHAPAVADLSPTADHPIERDEDILARSRPVLKDGVERPVTAPRRYARMRGGDERAGDAEVNVLAEQAIRVARAKREAQHRRDRGKRDVALFPRQTKAERLAALEALPADNADIWNRRGIRSGIGARRRKAGDIFASCQPRQIAGLLCFSAVMKQQLGRAERIRHQHRYGRRRRSRRELHDHLRMRVRAKAHAAMLLADDHAEEALALDVLPCRVGEVLQRGRDFPVVDEFGKSFAVFIDEAAFLLGELRCAVGKQCVPARAAREDFALPPDAAGLDGVSLRCRHVGQRLAHRCQDRRGEQAPAHRLHGEDADDESHNDERDDEPSHVRFSSRCAAWLTACGAPAVLVDVALCGPRCGSGCGSMCRSVSASHRSVRAMCWRRLRDSRPRRRPLL